MKPPRIDARQRVEHADRGVIVYGSRRVHVVRSETVHGASMWCGVDGVRVNARKAPSCVECVTTMERFGYVR